MQRQEFDALLRKVNDMKETIEKIITRSENNQRQEGNDNRDDIGNLLKTIVNGRSVQKENLDDPRRFQRDQRNETRKNNETERKSLLYKWKKISRSETSSASECESDLMSVSQYSTRKWNQNLKGDASSPSSEEE